MDPDPPKSSPRKVKFAPKAPPRRTPMAVAASIESVGEDAGDEEAQRSLTRKVTENLARKGPKAEKKSSVQVAFQHGANSTGIRTFGKRKESVDDGSNVAKSEEVILHDARSLVSLSTSGSDDEDSDDSTDNPTVKKKAYQEPWDYENSYYPTTLPWRPPYSGDPELLDKEEFGEPKEYDETTLHSAPELGFLDQCDMPRMFLFQFPTKLPLGTKPTGTTADEMKTKERATTSKGKEIATDTPRTSGISADKHGKKISGASMSPSTDQSSSEDGQWKELPEGYMGKMFVYRSGDIKLKLGDILFNVDPGNDCHFPQSLTAIDTGSGCFCDLGKLEDKHVVVSPDINHLMPDK